jgi:hypothetical protein
VARRRTGGADSNDLKFILFLFSRIERCQFTNTAARNAGFVFHCWKVSQQPILRGFAHDAEALK